jgi:hypothetical protein
MKIAGEGSDGSVGQGGAARRSFSPARLAVSVPSAPRCVVRRPVTTSASEGAMTARLQVHPQYFSLGSTVPGHPE